MDLVARDWHSDSVWDSTSEKVEMKISSVQQHSVYRPREVFRRYIESSDITVTL